MGREIRGVPYRIRRYFTGVTGGGEDRERDHRLGRCEMLSYSILFYNICIKILQSVEYSLKFVHELYKMLAIPAYGWLSPGAALEVYPVPMISFDGVSTMMTTTIPMSESVLPVPNVRRITTHQPWEWLAAGWKDLWRTPATSLPYGLLFVLMGYLLVYTVEGQFQSVLALTAGFLLVGPFLALGLYDISRRLEAGEPVSLGRVLTAWRSNLLSITLFGLVLGLLTVVWARLAAVLFAVLVGGQELSLEASAAPLFFTGSGLIFLLVFTGVGAIIAVAVFAISVVSLPLMLDRGTDFVTAILTSLAVVRANPAPMALWAALITLFTVLGLLVFYLGLAIALPLIGHATWHAYRDLVEDSDLEQQPM